MKIINKYEYYNFNDETELKNYLLKNANNIFGVLAYRGNTNKRTTIKWYNKETMADIAQTTATGLGMSHYLACACSLTKLAGISDIYLVNKLAKTILD